MRDIQCDPMACNGCSNCSIKHYLNTPQDPINKIKDNWVNCVECKRSILLAVGQPRVCTNCGPYPYTFDHYAKERLEARGPDNVWPQRSVFDNRLALAAMGISGEAGEVSEIVKKHLFHDVPLDIENLEKELGDVLWYIMYMADILGLSLEKIALTNNSKLAIRYPNGWSPEAARKHHFSKQKETAK